LQHDGCASANRRPQLRGPDGRAPEPQYATRRDVVLLQVAKRENVTSPKFKMQCKPNSRDFVGSRRRIESSAIISTSRDRI